LIDPDCSQLSISQQCRLLGISRAAFYYQPTGETELNLSLMKKIDRLFTEDPTIGVERMQEMLRRDGDSVNIKRVRRLMREMGLMAIFPEPRLTLANKGHKKFPNLLKHLEIKRVNQVWVSDITFVPLQRGWAYLVAIMDLFSRYILSWEMSLSMEVDFCIRALESALATGEPEVFHSDQGVQYTCSEFQVAVPGVTKISMSGRGRAYDNIVKERFWRSYKYEEVYLHDYENALQARAGASGYIARYNDRRPHRSLSMRTPQEAYKAGLEVLKSA